MSRTPTYDDFITTVWEQIDIYEGPEHFLETYKNAPHPEASIYAAIWTEPEISNGGFCPWPLR